MHVVIRCNQKLCNGFLTAIKMRQAGENGNFARIDNFLMLWNDSAVSRDRVGVGLRFQSLFFEF